MKEDLGGPAPWQEYFQPETYDKIFLISFHSLGDFNFLSNDGIFSD
jgi:hypothetical protein